MEKRLIIFDYDGVICDSLEAGIAVRRENEPAFSTDDYKRLFDGNVIHTVLAQKNGKGQGVIGHFFNSLSKVYHTLPLFSGIDLALEKLSKSHTLSIVSSTINPLIEKHTWAQNIHHHFSDLLGSDVHSSKVEKIRMLMEKYNTSPEECVFITDTLGDIREANTVGIDTIGVLWGFHDRETQNRGKVAHHAESPHELPDLITQHFSKNCSCKKPNDS
ncbi:MAG: HAD family hydrolase [bacterium]|nr:HAD family hydrolase [bacterium]